MSGYATTDALAAEATTRAADDDALTAAVGALRAAGLDADQKTALDNFLRAMTATHTEFEEIGEPAPGYSRDLAVHLRDASNAAPVNSLSAADDAEATVTLTQRDLGGVDYVRAVADDNDGNEVLWSPEKMLLAFKVDALVLPAADDDVAHSVLAGWRGADDAVLEIRVDHAGDLFISDGAGDAHYPSAVGSRRVSVGVGDRFIFAFERKGDGTLRAHWGKNALQENDDDTGIAARDYRNLDIGVDESATLSKIRFIQHDGSVAQPTHAQLAQLLGRIDVDYCFGLIPATRRTTDSVEIANLRAPDWTPIADGDISFDSKVDSDTLGQFTINLPRPLGQINDLFFVWQPDNDAVVRAAVESVGNNNNSSLKRATSQEAGQAIIDSDIDIWTDGQGRGATNYALRIYAASAGADSVSLNVGVFDLNDGNVAVLTPNNVVPALLLKRPRTYQQSLLPLTGDPLCATSNPCPP